MSNKIEYVRDSFEDYLSKKTHISASDVKNFYKSPRYYYFKKYEEIKKDKEPTHFFIGTAAHALILEPEEFETNYCVSRKFDLRTTQGKEDFAKFSEKNEGKKILTIEESEMIGKMATNALKNETFKELINNSHKELSLYTVHERTQLKIRLRPDIYSKNKSTITDMKTCLDSSPKAFRWDILNYGYNITAAFYSDFSGKDNYVFAALEKPEPNQMSLYQLSDELLNSGREIYKMCLDCLAFCYQHNVWPTINEWQVMKQAHSENDLESYFKILENNNLISTIY